MDYTGVEYYYQPSPFMMFMSFAWMVLLIVALWRVYAKAGENGWAAIVPFYSQYVLFRVAGFNPWLFLLLFIPVVNVVMALIVLYRVGVNFGKSPVWSVFMLCILSAIGLLILGFGSAQYRGGSSYGRAYA